MNFDWTAPNRILVIKINNRKIREFKFNNTMQDSQALHHALCEFNPGENYSIHFRNMR